MKRHTLSLAALGLTLAGCASAVTTQERTKPDGTKEATRVSVRTFFDGKSDLAKARLTTTDKTQGVTLAGIETESSGTNAVNVLRIVVEGAAKLP